MSAAGLQPSVVLDVLPALLEAALLTVGIAAAGLIGGFALGTALGLGRLARSVWFRRAAGAVVEVVRGTPLMVQVMFLYFGTPMVTGIRWDPITAGIVAIAINAGAYIAEIVRGAVQAVPRGQTEAARSLGLSRGQTLRLVVWPQAFRRMIPPLGNQFIISLKDTSLLVVIGVAELTRQGQVIIAVNFRAFEVWAAVALIYLAMTTSLAWVLGRVEARLARAG